MISNSISPKQIQDLLHCQLYDVYGCLGPQAVNQQHHVTVFTPGADRVWLCHRSTTRICELASLDKTSVFTTAEAVDSLPDDYQLLVQSGESFDYREDPYRFPSQLREQDNWLFSEGKHQCAWQFLGAHVLRLEDSLNVIEGTHFVVWAPNAQRVAVVGDFNHYDRRTHVLRFHPSSGIWEMFVPNVSPGALYRFDILSESGRTLEKTDPYARRLHTPADDIAVVDDSQFEWSDEKWLSHRKTVNWFAQPISIYEVHAGSWRQNNNYRDLAVNLINYASDLGFTHIQFLPLTEHPFTGSWGYQPVGMFAPTVRYGSPDDLRFLINEAHKKHIGVILDWVPAHFPSDDHGLAKFDGTALFEHEDPRKGIHPDWGTLIYNYARHEVISFLVSSALYWIEEFHIDAIRVDAVASMLYLDYSRKDGEWLPNEHGGNENLEAIQLLRYLNETIKARHPDVLTIAEESTAWPGVTTDAGAGGLGFDFKWNMGWMHDTLNYTSRETIHRQYHHHELTFSMMYAWSERFMLPLSHDEVVHGKGTLVNKMPGDNWQKFANLRSALAYMWAHPGKKLLFMGSEFGTHSEWNHDAELDWTLLGQPLHAGVQKLVRDLNHLYCHRPEFFQTDHHPDGFHWLDADDSQNSVFSLQRISKDGHAVTIVILNMTPIVRYGHRIPVLRQGTYRELLNTDSKYYGGSNQGNPTPLNTVIDTNGAALNLTLPPLAAVFLELVI